MGLLLSVISYHQLSPSLKVRFKLEKQLAVIGRSPQCDWHLPDNEKILSSKHAEISQVMDKFYVTDISTNNSGRAMAACTQARAGACPIGTQSFHTAFNAAKSAISFR